MATSRAKSYHGEKEGVATTHVKIIQRVGCCLSPVSEVRRPWMQYKKHTLKYSGSELELIPSRVGPDHFLGQCDPEPVSKLLRNGSDCGIINVKSIFLFYFYKCFGQPDPTKWVKQLGHRNIFRAQFCRSLSVFLFVYFYI